MEGKEYGTGFLILTSSTKKWPESIRKQQDNIERCTVFQNFSVSDQGRSRVFVCKCSTPEKAKEIADKLNSYEKLKKERDEYREMLERFKNQQNVIVTSGSNPKECIQVINGAEIYMCASSCYGLEKCEANRLLNKPQ